MIKKLHPTLKTCACGYIGTKRELYIHLAAMRKLMDDPKAFWSEHGESVLNEDDPRLNLETALTKSL